MKIIPLGNRVLLEPQLVENVTESGFIVSATEETAKTNRGTVIAIGGGDELAKYELEVGDVVVYQSWGSEKIEGLNDEEEKIKYEILTHDKITAVIK